MKGRASAYAQFAADELSAIKPRPLKPLLLSDYFHANHNIKFIDGEDENYARNNRFYRSVRTHTQTAANTKRIVLRKIHAQ